MQNIYLPKQIKVTRIEKLSDDVKRFRLKINMHGFTPGQFVLAGVWGCGEAPFGLASSPYEKTYADIIVRNTGGNVTSALHRLKNGDEITLRGPYGNGFPLSFFEGKDIVMATGGCGIPPIAALVEHVIKNREKFGRVYLLYGARAPNDILMKDEIKKWEKDINVILTIDKPYPNWKGHVGFVTDIVPEIKINSRRAVATMCGPGPMIGALEKILRPLGISDRRIFVSMERKMQCGVGKCQHCVVGDKYVCLDGPVFNYDEIDKSWD
jgi:NAD(P)H-flavin reductase